MRCAFLVGFFLFLSSAVFAGTLEELEANAQSGDIDSQVELGYRYLHGLGVPKDVYEARRWLDVPANEAQLPYAITMLGLSYWEEHLSDSDHRKALELFGNALEVGDADAHIYFGWMIATGLGRTEDRDSGIRYIETGQTLGAEGAAGMLNRLADMGTTVTVPYVGYVGDEGCEIEFVTGEAYRAWRWTARQLKLVWTREPELDQFLCEQTENMPVSVTEYLGKTDGEPAYYFAVTFDDCNMKFEVRRGEEGFNHKTTFDTTCHRYIPPTPTPRSTPNTGSSSRCVSVSGDCTGLDCIIDKITLSGGPGDIDNNWSTPMVCSGYNGALNGTYNYVMETNFDRVCSGSFQISSQAQSGVTVNIYDNCSAGYVSEY